MNRKERKQVEKNLGLKKLRKHESHLDKWQRWRDNQKAGKKRENEMKETRRLQENIENERKQSIDVNSKATELVIKDGLSYIDAIEKAKELLAN